MGFQSLGLTSRICIPYNYGMSMSNTFRKRIAVLQRRVADLDYVCSGNLRRRYTICGTANCRCKARPPEPHGPYHYWSRLLGGKVVQRVLLPEQAKIVAKGIENHRQVRGLLRKWEEETVHALETYKRTKPRRGL